MFYVVCSCKSDAMSRMRYTIATATLSKLVQVAVVFVGREMVTEGRCGMQKNKSNFMLFLTGEEEGKRWLKARSVLFSALFAPFTLPSSSSRAFCILHVLVDC